MGLGGEMAELTIAEKAYENARAEVERAKRMNERSIDFDCALRESLDRIPTEISELGGLVKVYLDGTKVSDLTPIAGLTDLVSLYLSNTEVEDLSPASQLKNVRVLLLARTAIRDLAPIASWTHLERLNVDNTKIIDLRPIRRATGLATAGQGEGLSFRNTEATALDGTLLRLSEVQDNQQRSRETLDYLNSLPPWPEPYTPISTGDGSSPRPIVPDSRVEPPKVRAAQSQIKSLLRHSLVTKVSAQSFAVRIEDALRGVPATHGNELEPSLQQMAEVAEVLKHLVDDPDLGSAVARENRLRLRIAQLEAIIERLTEALKNGEDARKAAEALTKKDGFLQSYRKSLGTSAAVGTIGLISVGVPTAAIYFLGVEHPLVRAFLTVVGRLPKS
jgi:hypothetical protein